MEEKEYDYTEQFMQMCKYYNLTETQIIERLKQLYNSLMKNYSELLFEKYNK